MYTSLPFDIFALLVTQLSKFPIQYYSGKRVTSIPLASQLLLTLMKLRLNTPDLDLAERFLLSRPSVANITKTFIAALYEFLYVGMIERGVPSRRKNKLSLPQCFSGYENCRLVMDATEISQDVPKHLEDKCLAYSQYKSKHTVKAVVSVAPNATIVHTSDLYPGSTSDVAIVEHSKVLSLCEPGDLILADKGFTIQRLLPQGVSLNIPPFLVNKKQFSKEESIRMKKVARARIHIERANERIKNFKILSHIPHNLVPHSSQVFKVCCALVNLQSPILAEAANKHPVKLSKSACGTIKIN